MALPSLAIVTTCRNRLAFLQQTLGAMCATGFPVTVVDFDCQEGTSAWVAAHHPSVRLMKSTEQPLYNGTLARNLGAQGLTTDYILFLDADILVADGFRDVMAQLDLAQAFYLGGAFDLLGQVLVPRRWFAAIDGYDEVIEGWGYDDEDLYDRLVARGLQRRQFPATAFRALPHSDAIRAVVPGTADKWMTQRINSVYSHIKCEMEVAMRQTLALPIRRELRQAVAQSLRQAGETGRPQTITCPLPMLNFWATDETARNGAYTLKRQLVFEVAIP